MENQQKKENPIIAILNNWQLWLLASLTLGLAPFLPEPHIVGKIRWVMGGAVGMKGMDWFDLFLHATPFILLFRAVIRLIILKTLKKEKEH